MSQPIFAIEDDSSKNPNTKSVAHLLPCRVNHDGPVDPIASYWNPVEAKDGKQTAFFRGRKLYAKDVALSNEYRGVMVERNEPEEKKLEEESEVIDLEKEDDDAPNAGTMKVVAEFDQVMVWGHENVASTGDDAYVRNLEEWIQVSDRIHSFSSEDSNGTK